MDPIKYFTFSMKFLLISRSLLRFSLSLIIYFIYIRCILFVFHGTIVNLDFFFSVCSQPLDFGFICWFDNDADSSSLPLLESESSSASLNTYRAVIAAESEAEIYDRIQLLENQEFHNIPPQNNQGEYENQVRQHFDQALNVDHYLYIWDTEYKEVQFLEKKGLLQDRLQDLMLGERNIERIMEISPYTNVREEAYHFLQNKLEPVNDLSHAFQRHLMDGSLNYFIQQMNQHGGQSDLYREFDSYFLDEEFRRANGLPLP